MLFGWWLCTLFSVLCFFKSTKAMCSFFAVQLNDVAAIESVAYLIKYDSVHGTWNVNVTVDAAGKSIVFDDPKSGRHATVPYTKLKTLSDVSGLQVLVWECDRRQCGVNLLL
jgi:glyceraldehyde-3-phosphate dehydrogenase/erythrose-4-phosphate dehydrogenase